MVRVCRAGTFRIATCWALLLVPAMARVGAQGSTPTAGASLDAKIAEYIKPFERANGFTGFIMIAKGGDIVFQHGYGQVNFELGVANTATTKFHLASISKTFTSAAVLLMVET